MVKGQPLLHDNKKVAILRPANPEQAVARGRELAARGAGQAEFDALLSEQPYTFAGIWGADNNKRAILDEDNNIIGELQLGDSFADYEAVKRSQSEPETET